MGKQIQLINNRNLEDPDELFQVVQALKSDIRGSVIQSSLDKKYNKLKDRYPHLYKIMCSKEPCRMEIFERMIASMKLIKQGKKTQEQMDKDIGYALAKEYIYDNIDMSKEDDSYSPEPVEYDQEESDEEY